jgi:hypothetical protein
MYPTCLFGERPGTINYLRKGCLMAKGEGRGWRRFVPSPTTILKVFMAELVIHAATSVIYPQLPENIRAWWPRT